MGLTVTSVEKSTGFYSIHLAGELDSITYPILEAKVDQALEGGATRIAFELSALQYISSAGLRVILKAQKAVRTRNGSVILLRPQPQIKKVFEVINALPSIQIFASVAEMDDYLDHLQRKVLAD